MKIILLIITSYLIGSISFAMLFAKMHGVDLRKVGSGNLGATNLSRSCGKKWAYICFCLDVLKGFLPVFAARHFILPPQAVSMHYGLWLMIGAAAIAGHIFPFYLKFKGGKGVATGFGVVLGIWPYYTAAGLIVGILWAVIVLIWKYISLGSIVAAAAFPFVLIGLTAVLDSWKFAEIWLLIAAGFLLCALVIYLHRSNIARLISGTEHKVLVKKNIGQ